MVRVENDLLESKKRGGCLSMKLQSSKDDTAGISNPTTLQSYYFPAVKNYNEVITFTPLTLRLYKIHARS